MVPMVASCQPNGSESFKVKGQVEHVESRCQNCQFSPILQLAPSQWIPINLLPTLEQLILGRSCTFNFNGFSWFNLEDLVLVNFDQLLSMNFNELLLWNCY